MPVYCAENHACDVLPYSKLFDTNLLVAYFNKDDKFHETAVTFIDFLADQDQVPLIPLTVAVEAWGMLGSLHLQKPMVDWIHDPGKVMLLPDDNKALAGAKRIVDKFGTDFIDALLIEYGSMLSERCGFARPVPIATFDSRNWDVWNSMRSRIIYWNPEQDEPYYDYES